MADDEAPATTIEPPREPSGGPEPGKPTRADGEESAGGAAAARPDVRPLAARCGMARPAPWIVPALVVGAVIALPLRGVPARGRQWKRGSCWCSPSGCSRATSPSRLPPPLRAQAASDDRRVLQVFGVSLWTERVVGFLQLVGLISAVTAIGYR